MVGWKFESLCNKLFNMKEVLYEVRCLKSTEDMILALAGQFKQLSHYYLIVIFNSLTLVSKEFNLLQ